jgi:hypothetical protein
VAGHRLALAAGFSAYLTLVGALFWFVSWLNRRVVRHQIEPRLVELEALRRDLFSSIP